MKFELTPEDDQGMRSVFAYHVRTSRQIPSLDDLVDTWLSFVTSVQRGFEGNRYDYTLYLEGRNDLEEIHAALGARTAARPRAVLVESDAAFFEATFQMKRSLLRGKQPWWSRAPKKLLDELRGDLVAEDFIDDDQQ